MNDPSSDATAAEEQRSAAPAPSRPPQQPADAPRPGSLGVRVLLALWLAASSGLCVAHYAWWMQLGLGSLVYLISFAPVVVAFLTFALVWSILGDDSPVVRWLVLPLAIGGLTTQFIIMLKAIDLLPLVLEILVAAVLSALLLWVRGVRIKRLPRSGDHSDAERRSWLRFSIADLLIATTGLAILLGLLQLGENWAAGLHFAILLALPAFFVILLAFSGRRAFLALLILCVPCAVMVVGFWIDDNSPLLAPLRFLGPDYGLITLLDSVQVLNQALVAGVMRWLGYRLQTVG